MKAGERAALVHVIRRLERLERIRAIVADHFEYVDDVRARIRREAVVKLVGDALDTPVSWRLYRQVGAAVKTMGWQAIRRPDGSYFRKCRAR